MQGMHQMRYFVFAQDLASALIGPFPTVADALTHIAYCQARGDSASHVVLAGDQVAKDVIDNWKSVMMLSPAEDREPTPEIDAEAYWRINI